MPLAIKPAECADLITPHDMHTDLTCAWSGSFLLGGGLIANVWSKFGAKTFLHSALPDD